MRLYSTYFRTEKIKYAQNQEKHVWHSSANKGPIQIKQLSKPFNHIWCRKSMQCLRHQRAKTSPVLLTHTVNSCCIYIKTAGSHFTYINVILEHVSNCTSVMGDSIHELPAFWSNNLLSCLGFIWCFLCGRESRHKQNYGCLFLFFFKIKVN